MQKAALVLGLVAALLCYGMGLFNIGLARAMDAPGFQAASVVLPFAVAIGAALTRIAPGFAALTMLFGALGIALSLGLNFITAVPFGLTIVAALLAAAHAITQERFEPDPF